MDGTRPGVGFSPQIPEKCAGTRIEPPPSLPTPPNEQPDALAAASPPLEPPAVRLVSHGLLVFPVSKLLLSYAISNSGVFVLPRTMAPAPRSRATSGASRCGTYSLRSNDPAVQGHPATSMLLLMVSGTPCNGPSLSPRVTAMSAARAWVRAPSASKCAKQCSCGSHFAIRPRVDSTTSVAEILRDLMLAVISAILE